MCVFACGLYKQSFNDSHEENSVPKTDNHYDYAFSLFVFFFMFTSFQKKIVAG